MSEPTKAKEDARPCPNCQQALSQDVSLCPSCGAGIPPLPEITNNPNPAQAPDVVLLSKSRGGDIAIGVVMGIVFPPLLCMALIALLQALGSSGISVGVSTVLLALFIPVLIGVPFAIAYLLKRKRYVAGNAMQKALFGWLILIGLLFLGLLVLCLSGNLNI
ncbi:MAG: hypothetical protein H8F28_26955 [Fibrella sp.]|nr:hypothetical protein [Armatimonadota bacterium]